MIDTERVKGAPLSEKLPDTEKGGPFQSRKRPDFVKQGDLFEDENPNGEFRRGRVRRVVHLAGGRYDDPRGGYPVVLSVQFSDGNARSFAMDNLHFPPEIKVYPRFYVVRSGELETPSLFEPDTTIPF